MNKLRIVLPALLALLALAGCAGDGGDAITDLLPASDVVSDPSLTARTGWTQEGVETFDSDTLFELVNGQAESYFAYRFEQVAVGRYVNTDHDQRLRVELYRLASPADAYGLFTVTRGGEPVAVGNDGDADPGRRLAFWQDRYYGRILAPQPVDDAVLMSFAQAVTGALPAGGEIPALVAGLPPEGLQPMSARFFRQELSIQSWLWLGGADVLGLPEDGGAAGVLADYTITDADGGQALVQVLLVEYPEPEGAQAAAQALQAAGIDEMLRVAAEGTRLAAVFGDATKTAADDMIGELLR